ncbi:MAG: tRNA-dihydrouridine synthase [Patescibacteria group bacterium]
MQGLFWQKLEVPFFTLAPMADVTDAAFRRIIAKYGKPDVMWTEFVSVDGLCSVGKEKLLPDLWFSESERPIVAQIFGAEPEHFYQAAQLIAERGFDGIDINMGCPDRGINKQGAGAELMKDPKRAQRVIAETKRGAAGLPVSIKTRIGYNTIQIAEWLPYLLETEPAALTLHLRTRKEMSDVPAHWEIMPEVVDMLKEHCGSGPRPLLIGNGDVRDCGDGRARLSTFGGDGVMIGRGIFGNPWLFNKERTNQPSIYEKLSVMVEHALLFDELFHEIKSFEIIKKHFKAYVSGFDGAKDLRIQFMSCHSAQEVEKVFHSLILE